MIEWNAAKLLSAKAGTQQGLVVKETPPPPAAENPTGENPEAENHPGEVSTNKNIPIENCWWDITLRRKIILQPDGSLQTTKHPEKQIMPKTIFLRPACARMARWMFNDATNTWYNGGWSDKLDEYELPNE